VRIAALFSLLVFLPSCANLHSQTASAEWSTGFWFWPEAAADIFPDPGPVDSLYVHVGTINHNRWRSEDRWTAYIERPRDRPDARHYWAVFRTEEHEVPAAAAAEPLAEQLKQFEDYEGVQLDIDVPTNQLRQYAAFLHELRAQLPKGKQVSITALLDWFRAGTAIAEVVKEVDEFVPQFYDVGPSRDGAIAAKIDAAQWGPRFVRFGKPYRIGISAFGRVHFRERPQGLPNGAQHLARVAGFYNDLAPRGLATNPAFRLEVSRSPAQELVLAYQATKQIHIDWNSFQPGDEILFTIATADTVRAGVAAAHKMPGCRGVLFFRWPSWSDALVMQPDEVLAAAGVAPAADPKPRIATIDGRCAAVNCIDLYLIDPRPASPPARRFKVKSSTELEYFLPEKRVPVRMTGPSLIELALPPYCGQRRLYLGRAVSLKPATYSVEEFQ
jgi:hypothetical protein